MFFRSLNVSLIILKPEPLTETLTDTVKGTLQGTLERAMFKSETGVGFLVLVFRPKVTSGFWLKLGAGQGRARGQAGREGSRLHQ